MALKRLKIRNNDKKYNIMATNIFEKQKQERAAKVAKCQEFKATHPDAVLFWRVGNMYEAVNEDADVLGKVTGLHVGEFSDGVRLCGFPDYSLDVYLPKLLNAGKRVAICEGVNEIKTNKTMENHHYKFTVLSHRTGKEIKFKNSMEFPAITEEMARGICLGIRVATGRILDIKVSIDGKVSNW